MRVAVTGAAGFIGSHVVAALVTRGDTVLCIDNLTTGRMENLAAVRAACDFRKIDVCDRDQLDRTIIPWRPDGVVHLAAVASVPQSIATPAYCHDVNLGGTYNMLESARQGGARRFVFASSAAVYGMEPRLPSHEDDPLDPASPYAAHKASGEFLLQAYHTTWDMETVSLRFFNVFGERQRPDDPYSGVISRFATLIHTLGRATINGDGEQSRDFIYVADVVRVVTAALDVPSPPHGPFNVARGDAVTVRSLYRLIAEVLGASDDPAFASARPGDVRHSRASIERVKSELGVSPTISIEEGLSRFVGKEILTGWRIRGPAPG